ncbi:hypothetical protein [Bradyrhizobium sp.]|uniref:hypothetical protein n=1 Tax=Bradyrhizobium sp. TaxID=376 RepID=UPI0025BD1537|nr:hypothetical protein [Bradyrhizobium sp.]
MAAQYSRRHSKFVERGAYGEAGRVVHFDIPPFTSGDIATKPLRSSALNNSELAASIRNRCGKKPKRGRRDCADRIGYIEKPHHLAFAFSPPNLGFGGIVAPAQFCCTGHNDIE